MDINPVFPDIGLWRFLKPYIPVNPGTGIPAAVRRTEIHRNKNLILPRLYKWRQVDFKGGIAILPLSCLLLIYPDGGIHIHPFKNQGISFVFLWLHRKNFPVKSTAVLVQVLCICNQPVMRQIHFLKLCKMLPCL